MSDYTHKITMRIIKVIKYSLIVTSFVVMLTTKGQCCGNAYLTNYYLDVKKTNNQIDSSVPLLHKHKSCLQKWKFELYNAN